MALENGIEAEKRKQQDFFELVERFRQATDAEEAKRLGDDLGRMVFSGKYQESLSSTTPSAPKSDTE